MTGDITPAPVHSVPGVLFLSLSESVWQTREMSHSVMKNSHQANNHPTYTHFGQITRKADTISFDTTTSRKDAVWWDSGSSNINFKVYVREIFLSSLDCPSFSLCQASLGLYSCNGYTSQGGSQRVLHRAGLCLCLTVFTSLQCVNHEELLKGG